MSIFKENRNLLILALIAVVNALGYGIIIPILYSYSIKFGLNDFQNGLLFAVFSLCQFISTPIIGRLSDKYGRKPLLTFSIFGTALSFFMMAFAQSAVFLFIARALDGITAGNIPVAQAVISDTTTEKQRVRGFGIIGASFSFGFVFGPAISALTVGISESLPFIIAGIVAFAAALATAIFLPETNKNIGKVAHKKLFDFKILAKSVLDKKIGRILLITLFFSLAFSVYIYAFQPYAVKSLNLSANQISSLFVVFGLLGILNQFVLISKYTKWLGVRRGYSISLLVNGISLMALFAAGSFWTFLAVCTFLAMANSTVWPLAQTILSENTDSTMQGAIMGINASYLSVGQILGPIIGGAIAIYNLGFPFLFAGLIVLFCFWLSFTIFNPERIDVTI